MDITYVYNPYDDRNDISELINLLGKPFHSVVLDRGIVKSIYRNIKLDESDYELIYATNIDPVYISHMTELKPTKEEYQAMSKTIKMFVATTLGTGVDDVFTNIFKTKVGYVTWYVPIYQDDYVYPSSNEEGMNLLKLCSEITEGHEPALEHEIFNHHSFVECAFSQIGSSELFYKDKITYVVSPKEDREIIDDVRMISSSMIDEGIICLPRMEGDDRIELFKEIADQWNLEVDEKETDLGSSISITNNKSEIPGHIWFEESASRISIGKLPLYSVFKPSIQSGTRLSQFKYMIISSYMELCKKHQDLYRHIGDVDAHFNGMVAIPAANYGQVKDFLEILDEFLEEDPIFSVGKHSELEHAIMTRWYYSKIHLDSLMFEIEGHYYVVGLFEEEVPRDIDAIRFEMESKHGKDILDKLKEIKDYNSFTGINDFGPIKGMLKKMPERTLLQIDEGKIVVTEIDNLVDDKILSSIKSSVGNLSSVSAIIKDRVIKLLVASKPSDSLISSAEDLWYKGFFLNDWSRQYYRDRNQISIHPIRSIRVLNEGIGSKYTKRIEVFLNETNQNS